MVRDEWACVVPMVDGSKQTLIGLTADSITGVFPQVNITKAVSDIIKSAPVEKRDHLKSLKLPETAGGKVDILLGILFASCHPEIVHQMAEQCSSPWLLTGQEVGEAEEGLGQL